MKIEPRTLKGFRDFLPKEARKRQYVIETLRKVFESYGFEPLETPALEYEDILMGKYGEEGDKLMYRFEDNGQRKVAMRYDQTVPLARVVAEYQNELPFPFKRYQIQNVWRAENTQKGRFREFLQCDIDTIASPTPEADAEIIACAASSLRALGFEKFRFIINDRKVFEDVSKITVSAIDKLKKIGEEMVIEELITRGEYDSSEKAQEAILAIKRSDPTPWIQLVMKKSMEMGVLENQIEFLPTLARGLDYYTSTIIELEIEGYTAGSVGGGGRYDNLIGMFGTATLPSVGFAFGFDRLLDAMDENNLFEKMKNKSVLVTVASPESAQLSFDVCSALRYQAICAECYLDNTAPIEKQFKYAEKKEISYIVVPISETEVELRTKNQAGEIVKKTVQISSLPNEII